MFDGMPSAPGKLPKRLSNEWFSIMISMTCLTGEAALRAGAVPGPDAPGLAFAVAETRLPITASSPTVTAGSFLEPIHDIGNS